MLKDGDGDGCEWPMTGLFGEPRGMPVSSGGTMAVTMAVTGNPTTVRSKISRADNHGYESCPATWSCSKFTCEVTFFKLKEKLVHKQTKQFNSVCEFLNLPFVKVGTVA